MTRSRHDWGMAVSRRGVLPADQSSSLREYLGRRVRPLAVGKGSQGFAVGLKDRLCFSSGGGWADVPWHTIDHGGWDADASELYWVDLDGEERRVPLDSPGRIPELFRERVEATIVIQHQVNVGSGRVLVISARRDLANPDGPATWALSGKPWVLADPDAVARANIELRRFRAEYEI